MRPAVSDIYDPQAGLIPVVPNMTREQIYEALTDRIPYIERMECTARVMMEFGVDPLLDQLVEIQGVEEEMQLARDFARVFGTLIEDLEGANNG